MCFLQRCMTAQAKEIGCVFYCLIVSGFSKAYKQAWYIMPLGSLCL